MKNTINYAAMLAVLFLAACGNPGDKKADQNGDSLSRDTGLVVASTGSSGKLDTADLGFFRNAAIGGMTEVEAGSRMLIVSTDAGIKSFAQMMVTDHTKAGAELKALAEKKGIQLPAVLPESNIALIKHIDNFKSDGQNEYYAHMMVEDHQKTIDLFNKASASKDRDISDFAKLNLPTLEHHYKMAKALEAKVTGHKKNQGDDPLKLSDQTEMKH
jgi:putative membrane protein